MCGTKFTPNKYNVSKQRYCGKECRNIARRKKSAAYSRRYRRLKRNSKIQESICKNGLNSISDLSIIKVNGQERVKGMVILEQLIRKMRDDWVYSP